MKIRLIRHGITEANEKRIYCGSTDLPLSALGKSELYKTKNKQEYELFDIYVTSGLQRSIQTLEILYEKKPDIVIAELNEMDFGDFEMKSHDELMDCHDYIKWLNEYDNTCCPNGESRMVFKERVKRGFEKLVSLNAKSVVVVCHGGVIVTIMDMLFKSKKSFYDWHPSNGEGYTLKYCTDTEVTRIY